MFLPISWLFYKVTDLICGGMVWLTELPCRIVQSERCPACKIGYLMDPSPTAEAYIESLLLTRRRVVLRCTRCDYEQSYDPSDDYSDLVNSVDQK